MIICSWNINSIRMREKLLVQLIDKLKPDVVFLQEIKCQNNEFPDILKNYNFVINGQKGRHGVAILVKKSIPFKYNSLYCQLCSRVRGGLGSDTRF